MGDKRGVGNVRFCLDIHALSLNPLFIYYDHHHDDNINFSKKINEKYYGTEWKEVQGMKLIKMIS